MDRSLLVTNGFQFLDILDANGLGPRAALWVYDEDYDRWRLWIVPRVDQPIDDFVFYLGMSKILNANSDLDLSTSDILPVTADHPVIAALGDSYDLRGRSSRSLSHAAPGGVYIAKGIILRMAMQPQSDAA
jgi:hypothetical protein